MAAEGGHYASIYCFCKSWHKISIRVIFLSVQSLKYEDNEQKWLETVTDWGEIGSSLNLTDKN